jgi:ATP-dependent helicase HrpB
VTQTPLPIDALLPAIREALATRGALVLQAPPGAGKTTGVPPALLGAPWLGTQSIVMLEPRRLATRAAAARLAELRGESVGETVGYRMRGEGRVSRRTRIEVVTEGVLTRRLQNDPTLDGVGAVLFDEFHERSLDADLALALCLRTRALLRDDLRLLIMSATLDGEPVARLLGGAPVITSAGRAYPVETRYRPLRSGARIEAAIVSAVVDALHSATGDLLVFLPGAAEIRRVESLLGERDLAGTIVTPLFGALPHDAQDRAIRPDATGRRKIVLSTSIAETSLTIEGIGVVIDSGLSRAPRFSPRTGMTRLETVRVSRASAEQRRGRAGRLGPGVCYRLWDAAEDAQLLEHSPPEIVSADLAPLALDLAAAGVADPGELAWLDAPAPAAYAQARELLGELEALDDRGEITAHGRAMSALPVHPRLGHMLANAASQSSATLACQLAALLSERDLFRRTDATVDADLARRIDVLRGGSSLHDVDRDALFRARRDAERLMRIVGPAAHTGHDVSAGALLALAYPDRVAQRRPGSRSRYLLRNGRGAELTAEQSLARAPWIVAAELDDRRPESRIFLAAEIDVAEVQRIFAEQIVVDEVVELDDATGAVVARRRERLGEIMLRESSVGSPPPDRVRRVLLDAIARRGLATLPWRDAARRLRDRIAFAAAHDPAWPDVSDSALLASLDEWLGPSLETLRRLDDLQRVDYVALLENLLDWRQRRELDELAPSHVEVPSGSRLPIDYSDPNAPVLAVRIQEVFGMPESPRVFGGRVPVTMHLLSPASRPVQVTQDLAGFWRTSYFDVRKDLRGRYPKHDWPEDPLAATATRRAKPRRKS